MYFTGCSVEALLDLTYLFWKLGPPQAYLWWGGPTVGKRRRLKSLQGARIVNLTTVGALVHWQGCSGAKRGRVTSTAPSVRH